MPDEARAEIIRRLRAVDESLGCLYNLVEAGTPCGQVLRQLCTVQTELQLIKFQMLKCQVNKSKSILLFDPAADNRLAELHRLFDLYNTLIQST